MTPLETRKAQLREYIEARVRKVGGCWLWNRSITQFGYGNLSLNKKNIKAHRLSWEVYHGEIPKGKLVCHKCDVRSCVNPEHLFIGTHKDNMDDCAKKGRNYLQKNPYKTNLRKLNADQIHEIKLLYKRESYSKSNALELGNKFGVNKSTIIRIANGRHWKNLNKIAGDE